jgi:glycosyltransferase involved in cell wall biosynthesis
MDIDETIAKSREMAAICRQSLPTAASDQEQLVAWLEELKTLRASQRGISICILTYNVIFYNKLTVKMIRELTKMVNYEILVFDNGSNDGSPEWLAQQSDVQLFRHTGPGQAFRHGSALDFLVQKAKYPITCTLCSDAFPTAMEWWTPAMYLDNETYLTGVERGYGRITKDYVCPSFLFGWTDWLRKHTFRDDWPHADTGEWLTKNCEQQGKKIKTWQHRNVVVGENLRPRPCDYSGLAWHVWFSGRVNTAPGVRGGEVEPDYHDFMVNFLRKKHNLDF